MNTGCEPFQGSDFLLWLWTTELFVTLLFPCYIHQFRFFAINTYTMHLSINKVTYHNETMVGWQCFEPHILQGEQVIVATHSGSAKQT